MSSYRALQSQNWRRNDAIPHKLPRSIETRPSDRPPQQQSWRRQSPYGQNRRGNDRRAQNDASPGTATGNRIYVGNLLYTATESDVVELLEGEGYVIVNIDMSVDRFTGRNPSYCFVDLDTTEAATSAMQNLTGTLLHGRPVKIKPWVQKREDPNKVMSQPLVEVRWNEKSHRNDPLGLPQDEEAYLDFPLKEYIASASENRRVFVRGLPKPETQHSSDLYIRELFKSYDVEGVTKCRALRGLGSRGRGDQYFAFVDFKSTEDAQAAIREMDGKTVGRGGFLHVALARSILETILHRAESLLAIQDYV